MPAGGPLYPYPLPLYLYSSFSPETPTPIRRKSGVLGCNFNNAKSQLGGFPFELSYLSFAVFCLVEFRSLVHVFHPVAEHAVDQSRQLGGHGFDGNGGAELSSESAKLRSQIGVAYPQSAGCHPQGNTRPIVRGSRPFPKTLLPLMRLSGHSRSQETK